MLTMLVTVLITSCIAPLEDRTSNQPHQGNPADCDEGRTGTRQLRSRLRHGGEPPIRSRAGGYKMSVHPKTTPVFSRIRIATDFRHYAIEDLRQSRPRAHWDSDNRQHCNGSMYAKSLSAPVFTIRLAPDLHTEARSEQMTTAFLIILVIIVVAAAAWYFLRRQRSRRL